MDRDEAGAVVAAVLRDTRRWRAGGPVAITAGLHGAGGFGKTTLARYVAAQRSVQRRFPGGVHLITIGRDVRGRAAIAAKVTEETRRITGDTTETGSDPEHAGAHLGSLLAARPRTLLVIDDVWEKEQLDPFLRGAERTCVRLFTTRNRDVLPSAATRIEVDRMTEQQARLLLTHRLPAVPQPQVVESLVKATGRWALLLGLANRFIAEQAATGADPTAAALALLRRLREHGPTAQDPHGIAQDPHDTLDLDQQERRNTAVRASVRAAVTLLQPAHAEQRFAELGIFAEDEAVPIALVAALWQATGGLDGTATRSLCKQMADLSLLGLDRTVPGGTVTLHDVVRDYLRAELGETGLRAANAALLDAVAATLPRTETEATAWWHTPYGYLLDHLIEHLLHAGRDAQASMVAQDFFWVRTRLHQRGPTAAWRDLDRIGPPAHTLARQLAQAAHLLTPTTPAHALDTILRSRITNAPHWPAHGHPSSTPRLINRWPPPDLPDPALLRTLTGHIGGVYAVAFSPDGTRLATVGDNGTVQIWDTATGATQRTLTGHTGGVRVVAFSPDGTRLATVGDNGTVQIWDPTTGATQHTLTGHTGGVRVVAFSPDGTRLATVGDDGTVRIWDTATGATLHTLTGHMRWVMALAFSPDGTRLATADILGTVRIWDPTTGATQHTLPGHIGQLRAVAFSPDGTRLATADILGTVRIWDPTTGATQHTLPGHSDTVGAVHAVAFSPDGTRLTTADILGTVRIWDPTTGATQHTLPGYRDEVRVVAFNADGTRLATADILGTVRIWDTATAANPRTLTGHMGEVRAVAFSPDGTRLATGDANARVRFSDPATGATLHTLTGHMRWVMAVAFSPDGTRLATADNGGTVRFWDPTTGATLHTLTINIGRLRAVAFSPDGTRLATADNGGTVQIWDPATGATLHTLTGNITEVYRVAFSPDGTRLATVGDGGTVQIWDPATGVTLHTLTGHTGEVYAVAFSPDGTRLATADILGTVRFWDPTTGATLHTLPGYRDEVRVVAFSPDGTRLATVGDDGTVRIWDTATGESLTMMRVEIDLFSCAWTPDGHALFAGGSRGLFAYDLHE
ncbi:NB-ARC domain-containing protein [Streptomyces paradoxus]|uniref:WD40 repeat protein n=1 Tax=Streptomyces paradoxus TaxID=66375 RepID=A0A7W9THU7_9ACTN|nr:NB-ARC domain-containing protein [Streptomyces paradoxus]MBB6080979.1 WD40 repeat protein [Streptomyces paradoxus]